MHLATPIQKAVGLKSLLVVALSFLSLFRVCNADALNVLVIGSAHDLGDKYASDSAAFHPTDIADKLQQILTQNGPGAATVTVEERYSGPYPSGFVYSGTTFQSKCYNLTGWFHYPLPAGAEEARWANLRGESGTVWDYVVIIGDPYTMEKTPGMYAQGVAKVAEEVAKGADPAEVILLMNWPASASSSTVDHYKEIVYRAGRSGGYKVAPAALAWQAAGSPSGGSHPNADGAYIAAASIYSRIYNQSASNSGYSYNDALADSVHTSVSANVGQPQYTGTFSFANPYLMLGDTRRDVHFSENGTSTEEDFKNAAKAAMDRIGVSYNTIDYCPDGSSSEATYNSNTPEDDGLGWPSENAMPIAWNHGRSYPDGRIKLNPDYWQLGFGYEYQWNTTAYSDEIANDHYIAMMDYYDTNRANDRLADAAIGARWMPTRMLWAQMHKEYPALDPMRDSNHLNWDQTHAIGTYMYTLYSGRCPLDPEPSPMTSRWMAQKIGYETAWRMGRCQTRAPGFKVMPSSATATNVTPSSADTMTVQFILPPTEEVTVSITTDDRLRGKVSPSVLTFTPANYQVAQTVTVVGETGPAGSFAFDVQFSSASADPVYDGLSDAWTYTNIRPEGTPPPDIQILGNGLAIESGDVTPDLLDGTDFGAATAPVSKTFTIQNLSDSATLSLSDSPRVTLTSGSGHFTLTQDAGTASIPPLGSTTFEITYDAAGGSHSAQVAINSSDAILPTHSFSIAGFSPGVPTVVNQGATGGQLSATLEGLLTDGGTADATMYWGTSDGGTTPDNWDNAEPIPAVTEGSAFSTVLTGLVAGRQYYFRCYASNSKGADWADATVPFMTEAPAALPVTMLRWGAPGGENVIFANAGTGAPPNTYNPATPISLALGINGHYITDSANRTPVFYGAGNLGAIDYRENGTPDVVWLAKYMSLGDTVKAMLVWKKEDSLADRSVTLTRFKLELTKPADLTFENRWVVEKAGQFYISDQTYTTGNLDVDASTLTWSEYTPLSGGADTIGAAATITLHDLDSVGFYVNAQRTGEGAGWLRPAMKYFAVEGDEDPDLSATVNYVTYVAGANGSITGTASQEVIYDGSTTAVTATADTGYSFANWSDGSTDNPRSDANVTSSQTYTANFVPNNQAPTADAGVDQSVEDTDGSGSENVSLDASASSDSDGTIASYVWTENAVQIATGINPTVDLAVGAHSITLTVTDDDGATSTDTVVVTVNEQPAPEGSPVTLVRWGAPGGENVIFANAGAGATPNTYNPATPISLALGINGHYITDSANRTPVFYGAGNLGALDYRENGTPDAVWLAKYMSLGDTVKAMLVWKKADFLANQSATLTRLKLELTQPADLTYENRWVVEKAGQFYISDQTYTTGNLDVDASTLTWSAYTPLSSGADTIGAAATITLHDLDSVGFYVDAQRTGEGTGWLRPAMKYFAVEGLEDPGLTVTVNYLAGPNGSITGEATQEVAEGGSTTAVTATPDANYEFVNWSDGSTANPRSDVNVTSNQSYTANFALSNQAPTADAGVDQSVEDTDGSGSENVVLDASASSDSDGTIASYLWTENAVQIATGINPTIDLAVGAHTITLTVTDDDGASATDTVVVTVNEQPAPEGSPVTLVRWGAPGKEDIVTAHTKTSATGTYDPATPRSPTIGGAEGYYVTDMANRTPVIYGAHQGLLEIRDGGAVDHAWLAKYMSVGNTMKAMLVWKKADFMASSNVTVTNFKLEVGGPTSLVYTNRWVIEKAGQFYVSDQTFGTGTFDVDVSALTWSAYTPLDGGIDSIGGPATISLQDVDSVGFYINVERISGTAGWQRPNFTYFAVEGLAGPGEVNEAPVFAADPMNEANATEGLSYSGSIANATDADGDPLTYSKLSGPAWLAVAASGELSGTPAEADVGLNVFTVQVDDGNGASDTATLNISVDAMNEAPAFTVDPILRNDGVQDAAYTGSIAADAADPEGDALSFSKLSGPAWLSVAADGSLSGTPGAGDLGVNTFSIEVTAEGGSDTATLLLSVNGLPLFAGDPIVEIRGTEGVAYNSSIADDASDPDLDPLTFSKVAGPAWLSVAADGTLSGLPASTDLGINSFTVQVDDGRGGSATTTLQIEIVNAPVGDLAASGTLILGVESGGSTLADGYVNDNLYHILSEVHSGGKPSRRHSHLEYVWTLDVTGAEQVTFYVEAHHSPNTEGDDFVFAYSLDNLNYTDMVTVTKTADDDTVQFYVLPSDTAGTVYIRAVDADRTQGNSAEDSLYVDAMFIVSEYLVP